MTLDFSLPPELEVLAEEARAVGREAAKSWWFHEDSWVALSDRTFAKELAARSWIGMTWPVAFGGGGRSPLERLVVFEALISEGAPLASIWFADRQIGPTLLQYGTPEQCQRWLPGIIEADSTWCLGLSEPDAGSDLASLRTSAVRDGDWWVVDGAKTWNSGGASADWCYLIVRTDPAAPKHKGLSEFVVDMRSPGITVQPIQDMTGGLDFSEIHFDQVRVPASNLVGVEGRSFAQVMRQLEHERGGIDRLVSNRRLFEDCVEHLRETGELVDPRLRQAIAAIESNYRIARSLVLRETLGQAPPGFSAVTKVLATELEVQVARLCAQIIGVHATLADEGLRRRVARNLCYSAAYTIMGGTTQILRNIVAERMLGLPQAGSPG